MSLITTVLVRYRMRASSVTRYVVIAADISSKNMVQSAPLLGAPTNSVSGDASKKTRMLYIMSADVLISGGLRSVYCSSANESRGREAVASSKLALLSRRDWVAYLQLRSNKFCYLSK